MSRFIYFYEMTDDAERIRAVVPAHVAYWRVAPVQEYRGGPFADRSGGLITFSADTAQDAEAVIRRDPFLAAGVVRDVRIEEWLA